MNNLILDLIEITFSEVPMCCVFFISKFNGNVPLVKFEEDKGMIIENVHYGYQKGMFKKVCQDRKVLIYKS